MFEKGKREQRRSQEDVTFNKMLLWLAGAVVVELLILLVKQVYVDAWLGFGAAYGLLVFFEVFRFLGAALSVAGVVWAVLWMRAGRSPVLPWACTAAVFLLWLVTLFAYYLSGVGLSIMMVLPAAGAVLIVIFFLYQRSFFFNAMLAGGGLVAVWMYRQYYWEHPTLIRLCFAAGFIALAAAAVLAFLLRRGDGKLGGARVMPAGSNYAITWITCVVTAAAMALAMALGTAATLYLLFVLAGWLFIQAVFFTVKLM